MLRLHLAQRRDPGGHVNRQAEGELLVREAAVVGSAPDLDEVVSFHETRGGSLHASRDC